MGVQVTAADPPRRARSDTFREVARAVLNALVTTVTLLPVLYLAIVEDVPGLLAETLAQAVIVAGIVAKVMRIPMIADWLSAHNIGPPPSVPPAPTHLPATPNG
jgi:hypothetical protein